MRRAAVLALAFIVLVCARANATPIGFPVPSASAGVLLFHRRLFGLDSPGAMLPVAGLPAGVAGLPPQFQAAWIVEDPRWLDLNRFESGLIADPLSLSYVAGSVMTCVGNTGADLDSCVGAWQASLVHGTRGWLLVLVPRQSGGADYPPAPPADDTPPPVPEPATVFLVCAGLLVIRLMARHRR